MTRYLSSNRQINRKPVFAESHRGGISRKTVLSATATLAIVVVGVLIWIFNTPHPEKTADRIIHDPDTPVSGREFTQLFNAITGHTLHPESRVSALANALIVRSRKDTSILPLFAPIVQDLRGTTDAYSHIVEIVSQTVTSREPNCYIILLGLDRSTIQQIVDAQESWKTKDSKLFAAFLIWASNAGIQKHVADIHQAIKDPDLPSRLMTLAKERLSEL